MNHRVTLLGLGWLCTSLSLQAQSIQKVDRQLPLQWKTEIGNTSFKTNIVHHKGKLLVGSNGSNFRDYYADANSGMYILDARTGKVKSHLEDGVLGDMDVNGVAVKGDRLYFGNDNDEFFCYTLTGVKMWSIPVSGDVESQPIWLDVDGDDEQELIFTTETGEVAAIEAADGKRVWSFRSPNFNGWDKSDNRFLFKVSTYATYGDGFYREPTLVSLNGDNVPDLVVNGRDEVTYAIDGKTGKQLWSYKFNQYRVNSKPLFLPEKKQILVLESIDYKHHITRLSLQGKVISRFKPDSFALSKDVTPLIHDDRLLIAGRCGFLYSSSKHNGATRRFRIPKGKIELGEDSRYAGNVTAALQLADVLGTGSPQLIMVDECGLLMIMDPDSGRMLRQLLLPSRVECTPFISDLNGDGKLEMLIACQDGNLYCYSTAGKAEVAQATVPVSPKAYTCRMY